MGNFCICYESIGVCILENLFDIYKLKWSNKEFKWWFLWLESMCGNLEDCVECKYGIEVEVLIEMGVD